METQATHREQRRPRVARNDRSRPPGARRTWALIAVILLCAGLSALARADEEWSEETMAVPVDSAAVAAGDSAPVRPPTPAEIRGAEPISRATFGRAALLLPRAILFPARVGVHVATSPAKLIAGTLTPLLPLDEVWYGLRADRYFIPTIGIDPELGLNAGFRAAHGNPLHGGGAITYRAGYGGASHQVFALTFRSHDDQLTPYRSGWGYTIRAKYENTSHHPYFGPGNESIRDSLVFYDQERFVLRGTLHYAPWRPLRCDLSAAQQRTQIARAADLTSDEIGIGERFPELVSALGPAIDPQKRWYEAALIFDGRNDRGRPSAGFWTEIYYGRAQSAADDTTSFSRYGFEAQAYLALARRHTLVLRFAGEEIDRGDSDSLHFSDLLTLGGRSSLRGFHEDRFVDYATVLTTLEYRYAFSPIAEFCLFMDAGEALSKLTDPNSPLRMNFEGLHYSYGGGLRYATHDLFCVRGFAAYSEEDFVAGITLESAFDREDRRERR